MVQNKTPKYQWLLNFSLLQNESVDCQSTLHREINIRDAEKNQTKRIRDWMRLNAQDYDNPTALAEACAHEFNHDEWLDDDTHEIWDHALEFKPVS